jgi:hypothetical protein
MANAVDEKGLMSLLHGKANGYMPRQGSDLQSVLESEARNLVDRSQLSGILLRLIGALGIRLHSQTARTPSFGRVLTDIDFIGYSKQRRQIEQFLRDVEYAPNEQFNHVHGYRRLIFYNVKHDFQVDVFLDVFEMCHRLDFRGRLEVDSPTVPLSELLASKLQIVQLNEKDVKDMLAILLDHELASDDSDRERINAKHIAQICASEWGIYKTFTINLAKVNGHAPNYLQDNSDLVRDRIKRLTDMIEGEPKTLAWKMRARIGERKQWYQLPDLPRSTLNEQIQS